MTVNKNGMWDVQPFNRLNQPSTASLSALSTWGVNKPSDGAFFLIYSSSLGSLTFFHYKGHVAKSKDAPMHIFEASMEINRYLYAFLCKSLFFKNKC